MGERKDGSLRVGLVCPYAFDVPGGVQSHIRDFASELAARGHTVSVLAPVAGRGPVPEFVVPAGRPFSVPFNGSIARLAFGPGVNRRVREWLDEGAFDLVHVHEPAAPSVSMLALRQANCPTVATHHACLQGTRLVRLCKPFLRRLLEKPAASIAVSAAARASIEIVAPGEHLIVPNGIDMGYYQAAVARPEWAGSRHGGPPTVGFLGRWAEPRKGQQVAAAAAEILLREDQEIRVVIAGGGVSGKTLARLGPFGQRALFPGGLSEGAKAQLLKSVDVYVAPQTSGESFGIVLLEAAAAGAAVVASDLPAFRDVLEAEEAGILFEVGNPRALGAAVRVALAERTAWAARARARAAHFDWPLLADSVLAAYTQVLRDAGGGVRRRPS